MNYRYKPKEELINELQKLQQEDNSLKTLYKKYIAERKQVEEMIKAGEEKYRMIFDEAPIGIAIASIEGKIIEVNKAQAEIIGYAVEELTGSNVNEYYVYPDKRMEMIELFKKTGKVRDFEIELRRKDGSIVVELMNIDEVKIEGKDYLFATGRDITKRKLTEEALRESETRYRELFNNINNGVAIYNVKENGDDFIFKEINRAGERMDGNWKEDIIGKSIYKVRPGIIEFGLLEVFKRVFATGIPEQYASRFYMDDKLQGWYTNFVYRLPSGEIVAVYDNITEIKKAEEELIIEKENFRHSLDDSPLGVRIATIEGNTIYANKTLLDFYRYDSVEELQKTPMKDRYTPESYQQAQERKRLRKRGDLSATDYEISIVRKNGEIRHLQVFRKEVLWDGVRQFQVIYNDVTERKLTEETVRILARYPAENPDPIMRVDRNGQLLFVNDASYKLLTWKLQKGKKTPSVLQRIIADAMKEGIVKKIDIEHNQRIISFNVVPFMEAGYANLYGHDITERKQAEEETRKSAKLMKDLHMHLNEIREKEHAMTSREIHDQIGQSLTALKIDLNWMHKYINTDPEAVAKIQGMIELVTNTIKAVQRISSELRPGILDDLGLDAAIEWYCDEFEKRTAIRCNLKLDDSTVGDPQKNLVFFRVLQEALTNVIRHANASSVTIKLHQIPKGSTLTIMDNGIGITREKVESAKSLGIIGMRERVRQFGGKIDISSRTGQGTKLNVFIPKESVL